MKKIIFSKQLLFIFIVIVLMFSGIIFYPQINLEKKPLSQKNTSAKALVKQISYSGDEGKDALTLLTKNGHIYSLDNSGLVSSIDNVKAETQKREYWAFYVNGKLAPVGPREYTTKSSDNILWKIEKY